MTALQAVLEALRWSLGPLLLCRLRGPDAVVGELDVSGVGVVVPARDEARTIGVLLASLASQRPGVVVVVDDESSDGTAAVAEASGLAVVVPAGPRPEGWNGKPWACHVGAAEARRRGADELVFVDADTAFEPGGLARVVAARRRRGGLVSVQPWHETRRAYEGLSLLPNLVSMMAVDAFGLLGGRLEPSGAFGPCLALDAGTYDAVGGHEGVRTAAMEDVALCAAARRAGVPVTVLAGRGSLRFRMYGGGVRDLVDGWTRGLGVGAGVVRLPTLVALVAWLSGVASAPLELGAAAVGAADGRGSPLVAALLLYAAFAAQLWWLGRRIGRFPSWAWALFPVTCTGFVLLFLRSLLRVLTRRSVRWKGRAVRAAGR